MAEPCRHLLQLQHDDGTLTCLQCGGDVTKGAPIRAVKPGQMTNILDDPLFDVLAADP